MGVKTLIGVIEAVESGKRSIDVLECAGGRDEVDVTRELDVNVVGVEGKYGLLGGAVAREDVHGGKERRRWDAEHLCRAIVLVDIPK